MRQEINRKTAGLILSVAMVFTAIIPGMTVHAVEYTADTEALLISDENGAGQAGAVAGNMYADVLREQAESVPRETVSDSNSDVDEIIIEESAEDSFSDEDENIADEEPGAEDDILPDGLIEEMEPVSEVPPEYLTEEFEMDVADPFSPETADDMEEEGILLLASSAKEASSFGTSYGQQLTGTAVEFYNSMVDHYINCRESGDWRISCTTGNGWYSVHVDDLSSYDASPEWIEMQSAMKYDLQSTINAFGYDYPEFFWERIYKSTWGFSIKKDNVGNGGTVRAEYLSLKTKETYTGSRNDIDTFFTAIENTVSQLTSSCDYSGDGVITDAEYAKGAHDFSATSLWYDSSMLSTYSYNSDHAEAYRIFTPAPAFIESIGGGGVCEAYSRTIKVLLDRFGVTCCLLSGGGHMWNGTMINGTWYLMDATWDDNGTDAPGISYLLSGYDSKHSASGLITETDTELEFSVPELSSSRYHEYGEWTVLEELTCLTNGLREHTCFLCGQAERETLTDGQHVFTDWTVEKQPSCTQTGIQTRNCTVCGRTETEIIPTVGHEYGEWTVQTPASCEQAGTREKTCTECGKKETQSIPVTGHSFSLNAVAPTCTEDGEDVYICSVCGETKKETVAKTGHSWSAWRTVSQATVSSKAVQARNCSACGKKETRTTGSALAPKISVNANFIKLKKSQKTTKITVSGLAKGDSVKSWTSSNTKIVTCRNGWIKAGKKTGIAYVTIATKAGASARVKVKVQKAKVAVSKISVASKKVPLKKGQSFNLNTVLSPLTTEYSAKYTSSNKKTASVSKSGVIKAKKKGKCTIILKAGKKTLKVKVIVY